MPATFDTLYANPDGNLYTWCKDLKTPLVKHADPVTVEFKRIHIYSNRFDKFFTSEVMVVTHVKNAASKDRVLEAITYFDDDAAIRKKDFFSGTYSIGPFDASEYGYPVCFHTPGYQETVITVTTKFWELNDSKIYTQIINFIKKGLNMLSIPGYASYITVADAVLDVTSNIITDVIKHVELVPEHTIEFRTDSVNNPFYTGTYVCFPGMNSIAVKNKIRDEYTLCDYILIDKDQNEYSGSYFVIEISNKPRNDLADFDYTSSTADILKKLNTNGNGNVTEELSNSISALARDAYDLALIKLIRTNYENYIKTQSNDDKLETIALYKQLQKSSQIDWFNQQYPEIQQLCIGLNNTTLG